MTTTLVKRPARIAPPDVPRGRPRHRRARPSRPSAAGRDGRRHDHDADDGRRGLARSWPSANGPAAGAVVAAALLCRRPSLGGRHDHRPAQRPASASSARPANATSTTSRTCAAGCATRSTARSRAARGGTRAPRLLDSARDDTRRWERRRGDADFLVAAAGIGDQPLASPVDDERRHGTPQRVRPGLPGGGPAAPEALHDAARPAGLGEPARHRRAERPRGPAARRALRPTSRCSWSPSTAPTTCELAVVRAETPRRRVGLGEVAATRAAPSTLDGDVPARLVAVHVAALAELLPPSSRRGSTATSAPRGSRSAARLAPRGRRRRRGLHPAHAPGVARTRPCRSPISASTSSSLLEQPARGARGRSTSGPSSPATTARCGVHRRAAPLDQVADGPLPAASHRAPARAAAHDRRGRRRTRAHRAPSACRRSSASPTPPTLDPADLAAPPAA